MEILPEHVCDNNPCNSGYCFRKGDGPSDYECLCRSGYTGSDCSEGIMLHPLHTCIYICMYMYYLVLL